MTFVFVKMEQSNAGIPVNVIKPVPKSEKIVGVGNMTNILEGGTHYCVRCKGVEGFSAADKDLGILDPAVPSRLQHLMAHFFPSLFLLHPHFLIPPSFHQASESKTLEF